MKRRNIDSAKIRRTLKKNKISEKLCGSSLIYLKLLLAWALVVTADFLLEFRFEYLWPFWLLLRSVYDSFRYQGVAFSVFFVCVTVTSDMICFLFIPVQWLFFLASTYVWVQYVWHTDRGVCLPTVSLWLLFIYVEASIRLRELKSVPFTLDLCRPFAAHCIGYPVVTLGFGVKSYVSYRMRMRKQRDVARVNRIYTRLLAESLSPEQRPDGAIEKHRYLTSQLFSEDVISNGVVYPGQLGGSQSVLVSNHNNTVSTPVTARQSTKNLTAASTLPKKSAIPSSSPVSLNYVNGSGSHVVSNGNSAGTGDGCDDDVYTGDSSDSLSWFPNIISRLFGVFLPSLDSGSTSTPMTATSDTSASSWLRHSSWSTSSMLRDSDDESGASKGSQESATDCQLVKRFHSTSGGASAGRQRAKRRGYGGVNICGASGSSTPTAEQSVGDLAGTKETNSRQTVAESKEKAQDNDSLESDIEKLKSELRSSRGREQELRNQIQQLTTSDKSVKAELQLLRQNNEQLQTRIQNLVRARQQDKQNMVTMEKKLAEEQKVKGQLEQQLQQEKKQRKADEASRTAAAAAVTKIECGETCKQRRRELENQVKQVRRDLQQREDQMSQIENEIRGLRQFKEQHSTDILVSALSAMQEKNMHLESSLSAETRVKLDLFSALGEAKRQLEIAHSQLSKKEQELEQLRHRASDLAGDVYMNAAQSVASPLTPPPQALPSNLESGSMDLLGTAAYQTAAYMTNLPGIMFDGSDYGSISMTGQGLPVSSETVTLRYSPPRNISH